MDIVSVQVIVDPVLDLTSSRISAGIGVETNRLMNDADEDMEYCRTIADWARTEGYWAILSPSAALPGTKNLNIYLSDSPEHLSLKAGTDRLPLNY